MPKANRGYQLKFCLPKGYKDRQWTIRWFVKGALREHATGLTDSRGIKEAETYKREWVEARERPSNAPETPDSMTVGRALEIYGAEHAPTCEDAARIGHAITPLAKFWGDLPVSAVKAETSRRYTAQRKRANNTVRRELGTLNAALEYCRAQGYLTTAPTASLPERGASRDRWLTRKEAAALLRKAYRQDDARLHLPTFIMLGLYTGHRSQAILTLQWQPNMTGGHVDLDKGRIDFNPVGKKKTNKRRAHIPIPGPLLIHLRLVRRRTRQFIIEYEGGPVGSVKRAFKTACKEAKLKGVTPHIMRHTACTWFMHRGVDPELAAGWVGMDPETFRRVYMHHHPDYMKELVDSFRKSPQSSPQ